MKPSPKKDQKEVVKLSRSLPLKRFREEVSMEEINQVNANGQTLLWYPGCNMRMLLQCGLDPNVQDASGNTYAHYCCHNYPIFPDIPLLMEFGAQWSFAIENEHGETLTDPLPDKEIYNGYKTDFYARVLSLLTERLLIKSLGQIAIDFLLPRSWAT